MKIKNKFYVSSPRMHANNTAHQTWGKPTLSEAIDHAKEVLEENPDHEYEYVVQIVRVIRRQKMPVIVEKPE